MENKIPIPKDALFISIKSPEKTVFEGIVTGVSSYNDKGPFDILSEHENFITIIKKKLVIFPIQTSPSRVSRGTDSGPSGKMEWDIDQGVLKVRENKVNVFFGIETV